MTKINKNYEKRFNVERGLPTMEDKIIDIIATVLIPVQKVLRGCKLTTKLIISPVILFIRIIHNLMNKLNSYNDKKAKKWCDKNLPKIILFNYDLRHDPLDFYIKEADFNNAFNKSNISKKDYKFFNKYHNNLYRLIVKRYKVNGFKKITSSEDNFFNIVGWQRPLNFDEIKNKANPEIIYFKQITKNV